MPNGEVPTIQVQHSWVPERKYGTSFGTVFLCRFCKRAAQCEIEPPPTPELDDSKARWWTPRHNAKLKRAQKWYFCRLWRQTDLGESGVHLWPATMALGPIECERCQQKAVVARIYDHPWSQEKVASFAQVVPP